jgi:FADH2 O2-dependent halogenase
LGRHFTGYSGHPSLRNSARAAHVKAALNPEGTEPGDITIYALSGAWFWVIPLGESLTSVGLVATPERRGLKWEEALQECPELAGLLESAPAVGPLSGYQDFTEYAHQFCGDGWALVGDAALFLDPVFSSGVLFALEGSERLSRVIDGELSPAEYESQLRTAAKRIEALIVGFYSGEFFDLGFTKEEEQSVLLRAGMVSLLSGDVFDAEARMAQVVSRRLSEFAALARDSRSS